MGGRWLVWIFSFSRSNWCYSVLEEYGQKSLKKYSPFFFLPVTWLFQFNEASCLCIHVPDSDEAVKVCDAQNKMEFLPWKCFCSSAGDRYLINHTNHLKSETVKWATKARYRVLWKHIIENWLNQGHRKNHFWRYDTQTD